MDRRVLGTLGIVAILVMVVSAAYSDANTVAILSPRHGPVVTTLNAPKKPLNTDEIRVENPLDGNVPGLEGIKEKRKGKDDSKDYEPVSTDNSTDGRGRDRIGGKAVPNAQRSRQSRADRREATKAERSPVAQQVKYERSEEVAIPLPIHVDKIPAKKKHIDVDGTRARVECKGRTCAVVMPKKHAKNQDRIRDVLARTLELVARGEEIKIIEAVPIEWNEFVVTKVVAAEENKVRVMYSTADQGAFAVISEIPKDVLPDAGMVEGNVVFLEVDPVLKIYLTAEKNRMTVTGYTIRGDVNFTSVDRVEFAVCAVRITDVSVTKIGKGYIVSFRIEDGTVPVYVPNVRVTGPGTSITPQYDEMEKKYSATLSSVNGMKIVANVSGCGEIVHHLQEPPAAEGNLPLLAVGAVVVIGIVLAGWYAWIRK